MDCGSSWALLRVTAVAVVYVGRAQVTARCAGGLKGSQPQFPLHLRDASPQFCLHFCRCAGVTPPRLTTQGSPEHTCARMLERYPNGASVFTTGLGSGASACRSWAVRRPVEALAEARLAGPNARNTPMGRTPSPATVAPEMSMLGEPISVGVPAGRPAPRLDPDPAAIATACPVDPFEGGSDLLGGSDRGSRRGTGQRGRIEPVDE